MKSRLLSFLRRVYIATLGALFSLIFCLGYVGIVVLMWAVIFSIFGYEDSFMPGSP